MKLKSQILTSSEGLQIEPFAAHEAALAQVV